MTIEELIAAVNLYFTTHLDSDFWNRLSNESKTGAVTMAKDDVLAELSGVKLEDIDANSYALMAIAEQAVYLARNYEALNEGKVLTGESIDGISESYTLISSRAGLSFRAEAFIKHAKSAALGATVRVSRG